MAPIKYVRELIIRVSKIVEAILPEAHMLKLGEGVLKALEPVGTSKGHQQHHTSGEIYDGSKLKSL